MSDYSARRILVCLRYGIGDVVMERPVLEALRAAAPEARITALGAAPAVELLEGDEVADRVRDIQSFGLSHRWDPGNPRAAAALAEWLDRERFDLFLDVRHAPTAVGEAVWSRGIRSLEADERAEQRAIAEGADGVAAIKAAVRAGWGIPVPEETVPRLTLDWDERRAAAGFLADLADEPDAGEPLIGMSPVASHDLKRWPADRFARTADQLVVTAGARLLLFHGPQRAAADEVLARMDHADRVRCVGPLHLRRVAALLARCSAFFGNDTGLMHVSAAVGTATIGVFGPTAAALYGPPQPHASGISTSVPCSHRNLDTLHPPACWRRGHCLIGERSCIEAVRERDVLEAVLGRVRRPIELDSIRAAG